MTFPLEDLERQWITHALTAEEANQMFQLPAGIIRELNPELFTFGPNYQAVMPMVELLVAYIQASDSQELPFRHSIQQRLVDYDRRVRSIISLERYRRVANGEVSPPPHPCFTAIEKIQTHLDETVHFKKGSFEESVMVGACLSLMSKNFYGDDFDLDSLLAESEALRGEVATTTHKITLLHVLVGHL